MSEKTSVKQEKMMQRMFRGKGIWKELDTGYIDGHVRVVREYIANVLPGTYPYHAFFNSVMRERW